MEQMEEEMQYVALMKIDVVMDSSPTVKSVMTVMH